MTKDFTPPEYTKGCCPCHRCKKIVAEKEKEIEQLKAESFKTVLGIHKNLMIQSNEIADRDATISRLRELLKTLEWRGHAGVWCPNCKGHVTEGHAPDCALKQEITEAEK